jgi:hypothetical protein
VGGSGAASAPCAAGCALHCIVLHCIAFVQAARTHIESDVEQVGPASRL